MRHAICDCVTILAICKTTGMYVNASKIALDASRRKNLNAIGSPYACIALFDVFLEAV